jgi:hypothetical protein
VATTLAWISLAVAVVALLVSAVAVRRASVGRSSTRRRQAVPADLEQIRAEVEALRDDSVQSLRHMAVVRYDAFGDMGGHLSWSMALLDDEGNGVVLTAIHGRTDARTYAKNIAGWTCDQPLSPEETDAVATARPS